MKIITKSGLSITNNDGSLIILNDTNETTLAMKVKSNTGMVIAGYGTHGTGLAYVNTYATTDPVLLQPTYD